MVLERLQALTIAKLLPFAKECMKDRPNTQVQEDNAPAYKSHYQQDVYNLWAIMKIALARELA
jgi:hypothetical protein